MADDNDDSWLYGAGGDEAAQSETKDHDESEIEMPTKNGTLDNSKAFETFDEHNFEEAGDDEHLIAEDSKDGEEHAGTGKFNIEEFESVGSINGQPAFEFAIENIEDKPWRKPGADITDYFNYGFNEETWRAYCERQKKMRIHESGIGLAGLTAAQNPQGINEPRQGINIGLKRIGGPRPKPSGTIDVIGAPTQNPIRPQAPRENVIQVMTADRREYSRTVVGNPQNPPMPLQFNVPPEEFYNHEEQDAFNYGYEPTQDSQWDNQNPGWQPSEIKELTGINQPPPMMSLNIPPPMMGGMPPRMPLNMMPSVQPGMIPPLMSQVTSMPQSMKPVDNRDRREREPRNYDESRKRPRERSLSRERERKERERTRDDRPKYERDVRESRYRESSSRRETRRSKSREKTKRSKSREKSRRSRSKDRKTDDKDKDRTRSDKSKRSKKEDS
ncbi:CLUMA_CG019035, isoform A [Clunio marinus]|uniref:CLUMA_CG019035, isoform A n=1 Tax=Clunio marinus TaxID=568069 RepID=A0A1J1J322_9DIPT|nr:CLUMA_CG019035, isoform A [Clunio marinus]